MAVTPGRFFDRFSNKFCNKHQHFGGTETSLLKVFSAMDGKAVGTCKTLLYIYRNPRDYITQIETVTIIAVKSPNFARDIKCANK